ncbi:MAG: hypothetical protein RLZZ04_4002 [Cyanobacteriota bacterium]|jgi:Tfp pilus assembly protein PilX
MKLLLLKTLLQRRARDEGFTLPMVIALGLVMVLLGVISLTTANEENITAIAQNSKSDALAIAEVGVARYRELLDRNRELTIFDDPQWFARRARTEVCNNEDRDISSFLLGGTQNVVDSRDLDNDGNTTEIVGTYSLVSYDYSNTNGAFNRTDDDLNKDAAGNDARGTLTVQGIAADDSSKAQIEVEIPLRINRNDLNNLAPALWIGDNTVTATDLGNLTIGNGNVVIKDQATSTTDGCGDFSALASTIPRRPVISNSRNLPSIQKIIDDVANARTALAKPAGTINTPNTTIIPGTTLFGLTIHDAYNPDNRTKNCPNIKLCRYYYDLRGTGNLTYTNNLLTDGIAKTTLLLDQSLTIDATTIPVTVPPTPMKIGSTSNAVNDSNTFEIYVNGANNITINTGGRTVNINALIHAPQSTLTITGGGTVNINGAVWVNDFVNNGATVNISPDLIAREPTREDPSTSVRAYKVYSTTDEFYGGTKQMTNRPLTGSPTNWKTEEVK